MEEVAALRSAALALVGCLLLAGATDSALAQDPVIESAEDRVAAYVAALRSGVTKDIVARRRELRSASDAEIGQIGEELRGTEHPGVRGKLAEFLADIGSETADDELRASLFIGESLNRPAADALVRRYAWVSFTDEQRKLVVQSASEASPMRLASFLRLLTADRGAPDGGVGVTVSLVLQRVERARADEARASRDVEIGPTAYVVQAGSAALAGRSEAARDALRNRLDEVRATGEWSAAAQRFLLVFRALLGDASVAKETLAAAADPQQGIDAQILAIEALPRVAGESARPVLARIVETTKSESEASPRRIHSPRTPALRLRLAATRALARLDATREEE